jgi:hypothetical protein
MSKLRNYNIYEVVRKFTPLPEILEKVNRGVQLTQSEFNTVRGRVRKMNYHEDPAEGTAYKEYRKARDLVDKYGFLPEPWYANCSDGSQIISPDRELLVDMMYGCDTDKKCQWINQDIINKYKRCGLLVFKKGGEINE